MSTIAPATPAPVPPSPSAAVQVLTVALEQGAAQAVQLEGLPAGTILEAVVKAQPEAPQQQQQPQPQPRQLEVQTELGPLLLRGTAPRLPEGTQLSLQLVKAADGQASFRLVAVAGQPLPGLPPLKPGTAPAVTPGELVGDSFPAAGTAAAPSASSPPPGLLATVLRGPEPGPMVPPRPGQPAPALPQALQNLAPGTGLFVRIATVTLPETPATQPNPASPPIFADGAPLPAAQAPQPQPPEAPTPTTPGAPPALPGQPPQQAGALPPAASQTAAPTVTPSPQTPTPLPGVVVNTTQAGKLTVRTDAGTLALPLAANALPADAAVVLEVVGAPVPPAAASATPAAPPPGLGRDGWPAFDAAVQVLAQADTQAAEQLVRMVPQAGPHLAARMSLFVASLQAGTTDKLLAEPVAKSLDKAGRRPLAERLKADLEELSRDAGRPVAGGEWRAYTMPFANGAEIEAVQLYVRRPPQEVGEEEGEATGGGRRGQESRFLLEVEMSRMGRVQLDGLITRDSKRFDLIIRTSHALPDQMRTDIAGLFAECSELVGTKGGVSFQAGSRFVELPKDGRQTSLSI